VNKVEGELSQTITFTRALCGWFISSLSLFIFVHYNVCVSINCRENCHLHEKDNEDDGGD